MPIAYDCASQCVWQEWMNAPLPGFEYVADEFIAVSKSVMYWFITPICVESQFSGLPAHFAMADTPLQTPFSVPVWFGKLGGSSAA